MTVQRLLQACATRGAPRGKSGRRFGSITGKHGNRFFYKGKGHKREGRFDNKRNFISDPLLKKFLVPPDLTGFKLKPYVSRKTPLVTNEEAYQIK